MEQNQEESKKTTELMNALSEPSSPPEDVKLEADQVINAQGRVVQLGRPSGSLQHGPTFVVMPSAKPSPFIPIDPETGEAINKKE